MQGIGMLVLELWMSQIAHIALAGVSVGPFYAARIANPVVASNIAGNGSLIELHC